MSDNSDCNSSCYSGSQKRRLSQIEDTIENLTQEVTNLNKFVYDTELEFSLMTVRMKSEKLKALSAVARAQVITTDMKLLVAERELYIDVERLKNLKNMRLDREEGPSQRHTGHMPTPPSTATMSVQTSRGTSEKKMCLRHSSTKKSPTDNSSSRESLAGTSSSRKSPSENSSSRKSLADSSPSRKPPADHSSSRRAPGDHRSSRRAPGDHGSSRRAPGDHSSSRKSPADHSSSRKSPADHSSSRRSPSDHSSSKRSPADNSSWKSSVDIFSEDVMMMIPSKNEGTTSLVEKPHTSVSLELFNKPPTKRSGSDVSISSSVVSEFNDSFTLTQNDENAKKSLAKKQTSDRKGVYQRKSNHSQSNSPKGNSVSDSKQIIQPSPKTVAGLGQFVETLSKHIESSSPTACTPTSRSEDKTPTASTSWHAPVRHMNLPQFIIQPSTSAMRRSSYSNSKNRQ